MPKKKGDIFTAVLPDVSRETAASIARFAAAK